MAVPAASAAPRPVTLVVGPEELLADRAVREVVDRARAADPDVEVNQFEAAELDPATLVATTSPSLFGESKVIVVREVQDASDELLEALKGLVKGPHEGVALVIVHRKGPRGTGLLRAARDAKALEVSCAEVKKRPDKLAFVAAEFRLQDRRAPQEAVEALLDAVGGDLRALVAAVAQVCADTEGSVDAEAVQRYFRGQAEVSGFVVADRAMEGRIGAAMLAVRQALASGTDPVLVFAALAIALRNVVKVATAPRGLRESDLARELGMPAWKVRTVSAQARGWDGAGVSRAMAAVAAADLDLKTGKGGDLVFVVQRAVLSVAREHRRR